MNFLYYFINKLIDNSVVLYEDLYRPYQKNICFFTGTNSKSKMLDLIIYAVTTVKLVLV